jgi:hypothetical protein
VAIAPLLVLDAVADVVGVAERFSVVEAVASGSGIDVVPPVVDTPLVTVPVPDVVVVVWLAFVVDVVVVVVDVAVPVIGVPVDDVPVDVVFPSLPWTQAAASSVKLSKYARCVETSSPPAQMGSAETQ